MAKGVSRAVADRDPDKVVDLIFRKNSAATIRDAQEQLGEETMEAIREAAMNRILRASFLIKPQTESNSLMMF